MSLTPEQKQKLSASQRKVRSRARAILHVPTGQLFDSVHDMANAFGIGFQNLYSRIRRDDGNVFKFVDQKDPS
jgi:hypothetical protein